MAARLHLVRHSAVLVRPERPAPEWHLSPEGRAAADALAGEDWPGVAVVYTSPEPKAVATAQRIAAHNGLPIAIERDLREVERRGWVGEGYAELVRRYLAGAAVDDWEARDAARQRVRSRIDAIARRHDGGAAGAVSHGLALTLYLADVLELDPEKAFELWSGIRFPDRAVIEVDRDAAQLVRPFGG